jgi:hypothetical protein
LPRNARNTDSYFRLRYGGETAVFGFVGAPTWVVRDVPVRSSRQGPAAYLAFKPSTTPVDTKQFGMGFNSDLKTGKKRGEFREKAEIRGMP